MPIIKLQYYKLFSTYTFFFSKKIINTMVSVIYFFHLFPFIPIKTLCRNSISAFFNAGGIKKERDREPVSSFLMYDDASADEFPHDGIVGDDGIIRHRYEEFEEIQKTHGFGVFVFLRRDLPQ